MSAADTSVLRPVTPLGLAVEALRAGDFDRALELLEGLDRYLEQCASPASDALELLERNSDRHGWSDDEPLEAEMLSGHVEGRFLSLLVKLSGARRVLDVGTFTGYSALAMAEALHEEDVEGGVVISCELDPEVAAMAREAFGHSEAGSRIQVEVGPATETLARLAESTDGVEPFDLAFLDADKPGYVDVLDTILDRDLMRPGALIVADNTLLQGEPYASGERSTNGVAIARFNRRVADDPRLEQVLVPLRDGVTLARLTTR